MAVPIPHRSLIALAHPDAATFRARLRDVGFEPPEAVFMQLFGPMSADPLRQQLLQRIDWAGVRFREAELSGEALAQVQVARELVHAVEETRQRVLIGGLAYYEVPAHGAGGEAGDETSEEERAILASWRERGTWLVPPVLVVGELLDLRVSFALAVGFTRLGELLGQIERGEVPGSRRHRVWVGERG